jgi:hypothetical protein
MKDVWRLLLGLSLVLIVVSAGVASAASVLGIPNFVGVFEPTVPSNAVNAYVRVRFPGGSTCDDGTYRDDFYIIIQSGPLDNIRSAEFHSLKMKNTYSTLLAALLSSKRVEIQGLPGCPPPPPPPEIHVLTLELLNANVSILQ